MILKLREVFALIISFILAIAIGVLVKWDFNQLNASSQVAYYLIFGIVAINVWAFKSRIEGFFDRIENRGKLKKKLKHDEDLKFVFQKFTCLNTKKENDYTYSLNVISNPILPKEQLGMLDNISELFDRHLYRFEYQRVPEQVENYDMFDSHLKCEEYRKIRGSLIMLLQVNIGLLNDDRKNVIKLIKKHLELNMNNNLEQTENPYDLDRLSGDLLFFILENWKKRNESDFINLKKKEHYEDEEMLGLDRDRWHNGIIIDSKNDDVNLEKLKDILILISKDSDVLQQCGHLLNKTKELCEKINEFRNDIQKILDDSKKEGIKGECKICNPKSFEDTRSK